MHVIVDESHSINYIYWGRATKIDVVFKKLNIIEASTLITFVIFLNKQKRSIRYTNNVWPFICTNFHLYWRFLSKVMPFAALCRFLLPPGIYIFITAIKEGWLLKQKSKVSFFWWVKNLQGEKWKSKSMNTKFIFKDRFLETWHQWWNLSKYCIIYG